MILLLASRELRCKVLFSLLLYCSVLSLSKWDRYSQVIGCNGIIGFGQWSYCKNSLGKVNKFCLCEIDVALLPSCFKTCLLLAAHGFNGQLNLALLSRYTKTVAFSSQSTLLQSASMHDVKGSPEFCVSLSLCFAALRSAIAFSIYFIQNKIDMDSLLVRKNWTGCWLVAIGLFFRFISGYWH